MNTIKTFARSLYRQYRFVLLAFLVITLLLSFPGLLSASYRSARKYSPGGRCR